MAAVPFRRPEKKPPALWPIWLILAAVGTVMVYYAARYGGPQDARTLDPRQALLGANQGAPIGEPSQAKGGDIMVVDGDTVRHRGQIYRLVGFDTPENGDRAQCEHERRLAEMASERLRQLISSGDADLRRVPCECKPGEEGTPRCNYGRLCGSLTVGGRDVGRILISERLAYPYVCSGGKCPRKQSWC